MKKAAHTGGLFLCNLFFVTPVVYGLIEKLDWYTQAAGVYSSDLLLGDNVPHQHRHLQKSNIDSIANFSTAHFIYF